MKVCHQFVPEFAAIARLGQQAFSGRSAAAVLPVDVEGPANLRDWFSDSTIRFWIEQRLDHLIWQNPEGEPDSRRKPLLLILSFAFLGRLFGSEEIANACRSDPVFQQLTNGSAPFAHELWQARRRYRSVLEHVLTGIFTQAISSRFGLSSALLPSELQEDLRQHAAERLEIARQLDSCFSC